MMYLVYSEGHSAEGLASWRQAHGHTDELGRAERYSKDEASSICEAHPGTFMVSEEAAKQLSICVVLEESLRPALGVDCDEEGAPDFDHAPTEQSPAYRDALIDGGRERLL